MVLTSLFVVVGTALGLVRALPQLSRLLRARDAHGVSVDTAATSSAVSAGWTTYGALTGQSAVALASGGSALMFFLVTLAALRFGRRLGELRATPLWLAAMAGAGLLGGAGGLGTLLPVSALVANVPQLVVAWRERDLSTLSLGTWALTSAEAIVWGTYGVATDDAPIEIHAALNLLTSGAIVALRISRSRERRPPAHP